MIAVLMASVKCGSSSWVAVRGRTKIHIVGLLNGDEVVVIGRGKKGDDFAIETNRNCIVDIPPDCVMIRAEHIETNGGGLIYVDLR